MPEAAPIAPSAAAPAAEKGRIEVRDLTDLQLGDCLAAIQDQHIETSANFRAIEGFYAAEMSRRLAAREARAMLHPRYKKIEIEEHYDKYVYDSIVCKQIKEILKSYGKDEEAAKVIKTFDAYIEKCARCNGTGSVEVAAYDEIGAAATFTALIERYGDHPELGPLFKRVRSRKLLSESLKIERKVGA